MKNFWPCRGPDPLPAWWRAIGDTNLRLIRKLNFFASLTKLDIAIEEGIMFRYRQPDEGPQLTKKAPKGPVLEVCHTNEVIEEDTTSIQAPTHKREQKLRRILGVIARDGLHARVLDNMIILLVPKWKQRLPDLTSLEGPQY